MTFTWTTLRVSNLTKSLAFYHTLLGLPIQERFGPPSHEIAMLGPQEGTRLELLCSQDPIPPSPGQGISLGFAPDNMAQLLDALTAQGIAIPQPISPNPSLRFYFIQDPDGYMVQLVENLS